ncbi:SDR family oxidoreductase [Brooklawnia cerclae]|uniref:NAD(P)-dependent dehydrogenase (Short-subunit alcohol dehydrogenase family) n=1 Tax=Brooklawnia cerclae TaxID=349934 RepID=A0ABX0SHR4_9ACTN|nr:SDR family oxidoreductase [Brooklawnia cerclae]NIH57894.1 NAD(P)-dependent dehydrogenase (short-subunit alcohol dehydrogenase family) [Brooklawnia cerclae]
MTQLSEADARPIAVVTGAGGGVGREVVRDLARDHTVIAIARSDAALAELAGIDSVVPTRLDVLDAAAIDSVGAALSAEHGRVDVLVHAAAVGSGESLEQTDAEVWNRVLGTNVVAPALLTRVLLAPLRAAGADVVFINSGAGKRALPRHPAYTSSKHALTGFANTLRLAEPALRVVSIFPGQIDTPMLRGLHADFGFDYRSEEYIRPASVAAAIRWVVDAGPDVQITNVDLRPRHEVSAQFGV